MRKGMIRVLLGLGFVLLLAVVATVARAQDEGISAGGGDESPAAASAPETSAAAAEPSAPAEPVTRQAGGAQQGFQVLPTVTNTYVVTAVVRGLRCVVGVGSENACAIPSQGADGSGSPWGRVTCRPGDVSVDTFARSLDGKRKIRVFEAPPALASASETRSIDVRLNRLCRKGGGARKPRP